MMVIAVVVDGSFAIDGILFINFDSRVCGEAFQETHNNSKLYISTPDGDTSSAIKTSAWVPRCRYHWCCSCFPWLIVRAGVTPRVGCVTGHAGGDISFVVIMCVWTRACALLSSCDAIVLLRPSSCVLRIEGFYPLDCRGASDFSVHQEALLAVLRREPGYLDRHTFTYALFARAFRLVPPPRASTPCWISHMIDLCFCLRCPAIRWLDVSLPRSRQRRQPSNGCNNASCATNVCFASVLQSPSRPHSVITIVVCRIQVPCTPDHALCRATARVPRVVVFVYRVAIAPARVTVPLRDHLDLGRHMHVPRDVDDRLRCVRVRPAHARCMHLHACTSLGSRHNRYHNNIVFNCGAGITCLAQEFEYNNATKVIDCTLR